MPDKISRFLSISPLLLASLAGCSDSDDAKPASKGDGPLYALLTQVFNDEDRTSYVQLTESLDDPISLDKAREFGGLTNIAAFDGDVLVSAGDQPLIKRYEISNDLAWHDTGDAVSFANYGLPEDGANFYAQWFVDDHTTYLAYDGNKRLLWDPTDFKVTRSISDSNIPLERDGLGLNASGNRAQISYEGDPTLQAFFYVDPDWVRFSEVSLIAAYDPKTHAEVGVVEAPCSALGTATRDEKGRTYFATWDYDPTLVLYGEGPAPCVVRVNRDGSLDESFTTDMTEWTGGRYSLNFRYIGNGRGIASVLHDEELDIDFSNFDPATFVEVRDEVWSSGAWRVWIIDVEKGTGGPIEGIDVTIDPSFEYARFDERTFMFLPYDSWGRSKAYEIFADDSVKAHFDTAGAPFKWTKVR